MNKQVSFNKFLMPLFLAVFLLGCQQSEAAQKQIGVKGVVVDQNGEPVRGVVVNDGTNFTQTDEKGAYYLPSDLARNKYVSISIPADYDIENTVVSSYYSKLVYGNGENQRSFKLKKRSAINKDFVYIPVSDPQVRNAAEMKRFQDETILDLKATLQQLTGQEAYIMTLGDNVFDVMGFFPEYKATLASLQVPVFSTIGNHDFDLRYNDLNNTPNPLENYAEETYQSYFGPVDYSFNVGDIHIVTMKDIDYSKGKNYIERFTPEQFNWLRKDLSYVPAGRTIFLNLHAPTSNKTSKGSGNTKNTAELLDILKDYNVHIFAGHTHFYENAEPTAKVYEHNIGAACGAWWAGNVNRCGAPNGYLVVNVKGDEVKWRYKSTGKADDYQFRIYKPGEFASQATYVVANIWDWDSRCEVKYYEDGTLKGTMEQFADEDQDFITMKKGVATGYQTNHLFRATASNGAKNITIEFTNRFGEVFSQSLEL